MGKYDTRSKGLDAGIYTVQVSAEPKESQTRTGKPMIDFEFSIEGQEYPIKQRFFPNQLTSMFKVLGFEETEPGVFDGDIQKAYGRIFQAELYFEVYQKDDGTKGKARRLRNFAAAPVGPATPADIAWEE